MLDYKLNRAQVLLLLLIKPKIFKTLCVVSQHRKGLPLCDSFLNLIVSRSVQAFVRASFVNYKRAVVLCIYAH